MAGDVTVFVPIGMRPLTNGTRIVQASGRTVAEVVESLEAHYPGFRETLIEDGRLRRGLTIAVNSVEQPLGLLATRSCRGGGPHPSGNGRAAESYTQGAP